MPKTFQSLLAIAAVVAVGALSVWSVMPPSPRGSDAPATDFSAARAFEHVQQVGKTTHVTGSRANDDVRDYLLKTLRGLGVDAQVQDAVTIGKNGDNTIKGGARVRNVVGLIPGSASTGRIFLVAHYDSVQTGPGGNDDGAGVSTILETVRALKQGPAPRNDIVVVLTDAEEACLCGAEAFVEQHPLAQQGGIVLNVEARGSSGPAVMFETSAGNADVVGVFGAHAPHPVATSFAVEVYRILPNDTDFTPFRITGRFGGLNSAYIDGSAAYHKPQDTPDRMDQASLQHHGDNLLALTEAFGEADLAKIAKSTGPDATYFPVLGILVTYPGSFVLPIAVVALLAVIALAVLTVRKRHTTTGRIVAATVVSLLPIILVPVAAQLFWLVLTTIRPGYSNMIDPWRTAWYRWAVVAIVVAIMLGWWMLLRRKVDSACLAIAGLAWLALFALVMAVIVPGGSYLAAIPALAGALAGIGALFLKGVWRLAVLTLAVAIATLVLAPTVALFFPALGLATAAAPALFAVLLGFAALSLLDEAPWAGWAVRSAALIAVILTGAGLVVDRFDVTHPIPSQLMYALDTDTGTALWVSSESSPGEWTKQFVSKEEFSVAGFPMLEGVWTGQAQQASLPPPLVTVLSEQTVSGGRTVRLRVAPQRDVRLIYLDVAGREIMVQGKAFPGREGQLQLLFHAPPPEGLEVTVTVGAGEKVSIAAADGSDGLEALPGFKPRPAGVDVAGSHFSELVLVKRSYQL
nr:M28 family peptidase [Rhizocola hellebori]